MTLEAEKSQLKPEVRPQERLVVEERARIAEEDEMLAKLFEDIVAPEDQVLLQHSL